MGTFTFCSPPIDLLVTMSRDSLKTLYTRLGTFGRVVAHLNLQLFTQEGRRLTALDMERVVRKHFWGRISLGGAMACAIDAAVCAAQVQLDEKNTATAAAQNAQKNKKKKKEKEKKQQKKHRMKRKRPTKKATDLEMNPTRVLRSDHSEEQVGQKEPDEQEEQEEQEESKQEPEEKEEQEEQEEQEEEEEEEEDEQEEQEDEDESEDEGEKLEDGGKLFGVHAIVGARFEGKTVVAMLVHWDTGELSWEHVESVRLLTMSKQFLKKLGLLSKSLRRFGDDVITNRSSTNSVSVSSSCALSPVFT
jgi:hypothetical protein